MEKEFLKIVCIKEDPMEYQVLEEANRGNLDEIQEFVNSRFDKHKGARWILMPCTCKI